MHVDVIVFATLRKYLPDLPLKVRQRPKQVEVLPGMSIANVRDLLDLPAEEVKVVMRNNRQAEMEYIVEEGDRIAFIPAAGGG